MQAEGAAPPAGCTPACLVLCCRSCSRCRPLTLPTAALLAPRAAAAGVSVPSAAAAEDEDVSFTEEDLGIPEEPPPEEAPQEPAAAPEPAGAPAAEGGPGAEGGPLPSQPEAGAPPAQDGPPQMEQQQLVPAPQQGMPPPGMGPPPGMHHPGMPQQQGPPPGMVYHPGMPQHHMPPPGMRPPQYMGAPPGMPQHHMPPPQYGGYPAGMPPPVWRPPPYPGTGPPPGMHHPGMPPQPHHQMQPPQQHMQPPPQHVQQQAPRLPPPPLPPQRQAPPPRPKTGYGPDGYMPQEEAVAAFKALLADKGVHAFSRYERELPKLQPDKRFKVWLAGVGGLIGACRFVCAGCGVGTGLDGWVRGVQPWLGSWSRAQGMQPAVPRCWKPFKLPTCLCSAPPVPHPAVHPHHC